MYHSIIEAAKSPTNNDLKSFLGELAKQAQTGNPRVFILGSVLAAQVPLLYLLYPKLYQKLLKL